MQPKLSVVDKHSVCAKIPSLVALSVVVYCACQKVDEKLVGKHKDPETMWP